MVVSPQLTSTVLTPEDFLSAAQTIPTGHAEKCYLNRNWIAPSTFLEWSRRGLFDGGDFGLSNAIAYAKRAACCRIDRLIHNYHLTRLHRARFPAKINALKDVGISIPSVIQELIINPRNELEHDYVPAEGDVARRAVDIATLFLAATDEEDSNESIIAVNMNVLYTSGSKGGEPKVTFDGWCGGPMLFIDIFDEPYAAKIVDGTNEEVRYTDLSVFSVKQAVHLAAILHSHYSLQSRSATCTGSFFYTEIKRRAGF